MKIQYLLFASLIAVSSVVNAGYNLGKTYTVRTDEQGGSGDEAKLASLMKKMDKKAAAKGDKLVMANIAQGCFKEGDYACAYENILISLTSTYWWMDYNMPTKLLTFHDQIRDSLSDVEAAQITARVKEYFAEEVQKLKKQQEEAIAKYPDQADEIRKRIPLPRDDMADKNPGEWEELARKGKILAVGHLAKKAVSDQDYSAVYKWATIGSIGASWQMLGESMLSYRDIARKNMNAEQIAAADEEIHEILLGWKYPNLTREEIKSKEKEMEEKLKELERQGIISRVK